MPAIHYRPFRNYVHHEESGAKEGVFSDKKVLTLRWMFTFGVGLANRFYRRA